jgi:hypothetical protein
MRTLCAFMNISRPVLLRMRNDSDKYCRENQNTHFVFNNFFYESRAVNQDNLEIHVRARQTTDEYIIRVMRIACWIPKATNTHSLYIILNAFPLRQWLQECASILRYVYIASYARFFILIAHIIWEFHKWSK